MRGRGEVVGWWEEVGGGGDKCQKKNFVKNETLQKKEKMKMKNNNNKCQKMNFVKNETFCFSK